MVISAAVRSEIAGHARAELPNEACGLLLLDGDADDDLTAGDQETGITLMTGGVSYDIAKGNLLIAAIESTSYDEYADELTKAPAASARNRGDDTHIQLVYRMAF